MSVRALVVPAVLAAFSGVVIWASLQLDRSPDMIVGESMQPRAFPIFLMVVNLALVALLSLQLLRSPPDARDRAPLATWGSLALFPVFYLLTTEVDFFVGIAVVMFVMCLLWGERRVHVATAVGVLTPLIIFLLFDKVLQVRFPRGVLTNWYYG